MSNEHDAPGGSSFAQRVAGVAHDVGLGYAPDVPLETLRELLQALSEQQAALQRMCEIIEADTLQKSDDLPPTLLARETLERWRIE